MSVHTLSRGLLACFACLMQFEPLEATEWKLPQRVAVQAGTSPRQNSAVSVLFDSPIPANAEWQLQELTAEGPRPVAAQIDDLDRRRVWWILSGTTAAGASRQFEFQAGKRQPANELTVDKQADFLIIRSGERSILRYNTAHIVPPAGISPKYGRSAYIHPVWTPKGEIVTEEFPSDHAHQSGIFLAFTKAVFEGRPTNFWEINGDKGRVRYKSTVSTANGPVFAQFQVAQEHVDLTAPGGGKVALNETWDVRAWQTDGPWSGYWMFDVESTLTCATSHPLQLPTYHYGGFAVRGSKLWTKEVSHFLTADRHNRDNGNHGRTHWTDLYGPVSSGEQAGIAMLTHPANFRFPEPVRIHGSMPYFVYTASPLGDWSIEPNQPHVSRYRCIIHDGAPDFERLQQLWSDFATPPEVTVTAG